MTVGLFLLTLLGRFYVRTAPLLSVVNYLDPAHGVRSCPADNVRHVDQVCRTVLVKAYTRLVAHLDYK